MSNGAKHELSDEMAGKQRYAAWRAGELAKANREGRTAAPPPLAWARLGAAPLEEPGDDPLEEPGDDPDIPVVGR